MQAAPSGAIESSPGRSPGKSAHQGRSPVGTVEGELVSRPYGTSPFFELDSQHFVLGYSQSSLRDFPSYVAGILRPIDY